MADAHHDPYQVGVWRQWVWNERSAVPVPQTAPVEVADSQRCGPGQWSSVWEVRSRESRHECADEGSAMPWWYPAGLENQKEVKRQAAGEVGVMGSEAVPQAVVLGEVLKVGMDVRDGAGRGEGVDGGDQETTVGRDGVRAGSAAGVLGREDR